MYIGYMQMLPHFYICRLEHLKILVRGGERCLEPVVLAYKGL